MKKRFIYIAAALMTAVSPASAMAQETAETVIDNKIQSEGETSVKNDAVNAESGSSGENTVTAETAETTENADKNGTGETAGNKTGNEGNAKPGENGEPGETAENGEAGETGESGESGETSETGGTEETGEPGDTSETNVPDEKEGFTDVEEGVWYADAVNYVTERGIMSGTSESTFSPELPSTRGMMALIISNINGETEKVYWSYLDVPEGSWYADAIAWCSDKNVMKGYGGGYFGPDDSLTREQLVSILYRYAQYRNFSNLETTGVELLDYNDYAKVSGYAGGPMQWALKNSILSGKENDMLDPQGVASRAEIAQIIRNFMVFYNL